MDPVLYVSPEEKKVNEKLWCVLGKLRRSDQKGKSKNM